MIVTRKDIFNYMFMPQLRGRFSALFASGFKHIPYFVALVYQTVRLLPENHAYLDTQNIGRFGVRHVIAEAANNLVIDKKNIDQILLFFMVLAGLVLLCVQLSLLGLSLFIQPVLAQVAMPGSFVGLFLVDNPEQDLAFILMDMVFGVEGLFNSCVANTAVDCLDVNGERVVSSAGQWLLSDLGWPFPVHTATHQLFALYSTGLLVVAALITSYFIATVILETAQTGTPFGKRFNKVWAPLRLVVAIGLLVPLQQGLNASQYIVLYAAKFGSGFATNGWNLFNESLANTAGPASGLVIGGPQLPDDNRKYIATPNPPDVKPVLQNAFCC